MRMHAYHSIVLSLLCVFTLNACSSNSNSYENKSVSGLCSTYAVQTMVANPNLIFLISTSTPIPVTCTPSQIEKSNISDQFTPVSTSTPIPTSSPVPSLTPYMTQTNTFGLMSASGECINAAEFVQDVTIPDDSIVEPNKEFTKTWRLRNIGSCSWTTKFALVLISGDQMEAISPKMLEANVEPGQTIDLSIDLVSPKEPNYYQGNWMLQDEFGNTFGTGSDAGNPFWVSIKVYEAGWRIIFQGIGGGTGGSGGCGSGG